MNQLNGFCDLCLSGSVSSKELISMLKEAVELNYKIVAIEQVYNDIKTDSKAKKGDPITEPITLDLKEFEGKLRILNRLTVVFDNNAVTLVLNKSKNLKKYHIVAALPTTESSLQFACQTLNCDIITYNDDSTRIRILRTHYLQAVSRNIFFELKYSPCIVDSNERKSTIFKARKYRDIGKAKHIILSSGAQNQFQMRGPYDVANLGWIFGLSEEQSKEAIRGKCHQVIYKGETRRHGSAMVFTKKLKKLGVYDSDEISDSDNDGEDKPKYSEIPASEISPDNIEYETNENPPKRIKLSEAYTVDKDLKSFIEENLKE